MLIEQAIAECEARFVALTPKSALAFEQADRVLTAGNTRNNLFHTPHMVMIDRAEGDVLLDIDGNRYVDLLNDFTVSMFGHSNPKLADAVLNTLNRGMSFGGVVVEEAELAQSLRQRFPSMERLRFANSGTEANLYAIQAAFAYSGRKKLLIFEGNYHGGILNYCHQGPILNFPVETVSVPYNDISALESAMASHGNELGAVIMELMMNTGGCIPADRVFTEATRALCTRFQVPLIIDEVMTARLVYGGLQEHFGIQADVTTLGKMIGGGFSAGAFGGSEALMRAYDPRDGELIPHGGSFNNNAMSMRVGLVAVRDVLTRSELARVSELGNSLRSALNAELEAADLPLVFSGLGSVMNLHFGRQQRLQVQRDWRDKWVQRLFHRFMLINGYWVATRALLALSVQTRAESLQGFESVFREFLNRFGDSIRALEGEEYARTGAN